MKPTKLQWEDVIQFEEVKGKQLLEKKICPSKINQ